jgi:hypothetical protein
MARKEANLMYKSSLAAHKTSYKMSVCWCSVGTF